MDKSLDEALHHIDKLKEDMNHLCHDIDSLYKTKNLSHISNISSIKNSNPYLLNIKNNRSNSPNDSFHVDSSNNDKKYADYEYDYDFDVDKSTSNFLSNLTTSDMTIHNEINVTSALSKTPVICLDKCSQTKIFSLMDFSLYSDDSDESTSNTTISRKTCSPMYSFLQTSPHSNEAISSIHLNSHKKQNSFNYCHLSKKLLFNKKKSPLHR